MPLLFLNSLHMINKAYDRVRKSIQHQFDLMGAEVDVLMFLANHPEHNTAQEIVDLRKLTKSHASLAIKQLESKGYITRSTNPENRKENHIQLTSKSQPVTRYGQQLQQAFIDQLFQGFSSKQKQAFVQALNQIEENLLERTSS